MKPYQDAVESVAKAIAELKLTGTDRWFLAKDVGELAYTYKLPVDVVKSDVLAKVDILVDSLAV